MRTTALIVPWAALLITGAIYAHPVMAVEQDSRASPNGLVHRTFPPQARAAGILARDVGTTAPGSAGDSTSPARHPKRQLVEVVKAVGKKILDGFKHLFKKKKEKKKEEKQAAAQNSTARVHRRDLGATDPGSGPTDPGSLPDGPVSAGPSEGKGEKADKETHNRAGHTFKKQRNQEKQGGKAHQRGRQGGHADRRGLSARELDNLD